MNYQFYRVVLLILMIQVNPISRKRKIIERKINLKDIIPKILQLNLPMRLELLKSWKI
jgi:hypothetical protein